MPRSHETLNEQNQQQAHPQQQQQQPIQQPQQQHQHHQSQLASHNLRKASIVSEDSDIFLASDKMYGLPVTAITGTEPITIKPPYLSIKGRHETTSTESKDTLTPIEALTPITEPQAPIITSTGGAVAAAAAAAPITVADDDDEDASTENIMELNFETARQKAQRRRSMGRRLSSECCSNYDLNRSQTSLNAALAMSRRQLSLTQSEPDSGNEMTGIPSEYKIERVTLTLFYISYIHHSLNMKAKEKNKKINK